MQSYQRMRPTSIFISVVFTTTLAVAAPSSWLSFNSPEINVALLPLNDGNIVQSLSTRPPAEVLAKLEADRKAVTPANAKNAKFLSDSAALDLYIYGALRAENAKSLLETAERISPGLYSVAINLATANEFLGDLDEALKWVEEARGRNPLAHSGTEWLQQLILRAKLEIAAAPDWLKTNSVLGVDFGTGENPIWPRVADRQNWSTRSRQALLLQLRDRLPLAKKPDAVVADLLFDFGNLQFLAGSPATANEFYKLALSFSLEKKAIAEKRVSLIQKEAPVGPLKSVGNQIALGILAAIAVGGFVSLYLNRKKRQRRPQNPAG